MKKYTENEINGMLIDYTSSSYNVDFEQFGEFGGLVREEFVDFATQWQDLPCDDEGFTPEQDKVADELIDEFTNKILKIIGQ